jgi:hypothetical protein
MNRPDDIINALRRIQSRGLREDEGDILHDILHGRSLMDEREKKVEAWKAFLAMDLDSMLKRATGLDNLEKFKRTWKTDEEYEEPGTDERAQYEEAMYPGMDIYYPIEDRTPTIDQLRVRVQKEVHAKLRELGFNVQKLAWDPETRKDVSGQIRRAIEGYVRAWVTYNRLDDWEAMNVLYR